MMLGDALRVLLQLRERLAHRVDDDRHELVQERLAQLELLPAEAHRAAEDAAQHVAAALVARHRAVGQRERQAAHVVRDHAERDVVSELRVRRLGDGVGGVRRRDTCRCT